MEFRPEFLRTSTEELVPLENAHVVLVPVQYVLEARAQVHSKNESESILDVSHCALETSETN